MAALDWSQCPVSRLIADCGLVLPWSCSGEKTASGALVGHMHHVHAGHRAEQLGGKVVGTAAAIGAEVQFARLCLGVRDQFRSGIHWHVRIHDEDVGRGAEQADRGEVTHRVIGQVLQHAGVGAVGAPVPISRV